MDQEALAFLDGERPTAAPPLLQAIWCGLHGEWDAAHALAQDDDSAGGAWVHAWLHRVEGDLTNAGYWYRRARRPAATGDVPAEGREIAAAILAAQS